MTARPDAAPPHPGAAPPGVVLSPEGYAELFAEWARRPDAAPFAGGTALLRGTARPPAAVLSLEKIEEMRRVNRTERYLEIGAMVTLGAVVGLRKFVPSVLVQCLRGISGPHLRNMATIGGNVCCHLDSAAALTALDAQYELRGAESSRWVTAARFSPEPGPWSLGPGELLGRIRVPLESWDLSAYGKFEGGSAVFLARHQKDMLADIRVICRAAGRIWRDKDGENTLAGKRLPLGRRAAAAFAARWDAILRGAEGAVGGAGGGLPRGELVGFIESSVGSLEE